MSWNQENAPAKINLALHVRARRADGYHEIDSLFAFATDGDTVAAQMRSDGALTLAIDGPFGDGLDAGPDNLVVCAAEALRRATGGIAGADIRLTKRLPVASGIGGGSADAAATLRLLNRLWATGLGEGALARLGEGLGSDVPACVLGRTLVARGRGEAMEPLALDGLAGAPLLLVNPGIAVPTGPVFRAWDGMDRGALDVSDLDAVIAAGRNDLEAPALGLAPVIADVLAALRARAGVRLTRMSGSGATCFALFEEDASCVAAERALEGTGWWTMRSHIA